MPDTGDIVINTGPFLAFAAAWQTLSPLQQIYKKVLVPQEVVDELQRGGKTGFGCAEFAAASSWLTKCPARSRFAPILKASLDIGEASVVQLALDDNVPTVCIDETVGRRVARLAGLRVTGSIGVLLKLVGQPGLPDFSVAVERMRAHGIWISDRVIEVALKEAARKN